MVDLDPLSHCLFLQVGNRNGTVFFSDQSHEVVLLFDLGVSFLLFLVVGQDPYIHIFALGALYALDEVVGRQFFEDFVEQVGGEFGSLTQILLGAGVLLDDGVYFAIGVAENGSEDACCPLLLTLHTRNTIYMQQDIWNTFIFGRLTISYRELVLTLNRGFNTAHSSSNNRHNFLVRVEVAGLQVKGYGQSGLPPKKPHCYLADVKDCKHYMQQLADSLLGLSINDKRLEIADIIDKVFEGIPDKYFEQCRLKNLKIFKHAEVGQEILVLLNQARNILSKQFRAAYSALQFALLDCWAQLAGSSLTHLIFPADEVKQCQKCCSFYSVSYEAEDQMVNNVLSALKYTHFIKIKAVDDVKGLLHLLDRLQKQTQGKIIKYIIDANASWKSQSCQEFIDAVSQSQYEQIKSKILYLQQPFPVLLEPHEQKAWQQVHRKSTLKIVADQTFFDCQQIDSIVSLCSGINIKTEKVGGAINALRAGLLGRERKLQLMLGSMVTTQLGCSQTYCLYPLTPYLDTDGSLLVREPEVRGGFEWGPEGYLIHPKESRFGAEIDTTVFDV